MFATVNRDEHTDPAPYPDPLPRPGDATDPSSPADPSGLSGPRAATPAEIVAFLNSPA